MNFTDAQRADAAAFHAAPALQQTAQECAVIICIPTRGQISHETQLTIEQNLGGVQHAVMRVARKPVDEARNLLAKTVLELIEQNPFGQRETFILWLDDDAWLPPGVVPTMLQCLNDPRMGQLDALFGWFSTRMPYAAPVAYRNIDDPQSFPKLGIDCNNGGVVPIEAAGFHAVMMRPTLLRRIGREPFTPDPSRVEGEDFAFCRRAKKIGARLAVGTALPAVHVDPRDGTGYLPGMPAMLMDGNGMRPLTLDHSVHGTIKKAETRSYGLASESQIANESAEYERSINSELARRRASATEALT